MLVIGNRKPSMLTWDKDIAFAITRPVVTVNAKGPLAKEVEFAPATVNTPNPGDNTTFGANEAEFDPATARVVWGSTSTEEV